MVGEERAGDFIEKYELLRPVAQGGMGSVWAAKLHGPHGFEKLVAIKTVLPELAGDAQVRAMFLDEARLASAIVHRNIAHVLDFLEHEGSLYIVMEWVEGVSLMWLHEHLAARGSQVPVGIALRVLADVCAGLHAAHELTTFEGEPCGLVHRDVSPQNVLVAIEGAAKLIDFGVAKTRFRIASDSTLGELRGRLAFMAPEQAHCDVLDRRADVWSVGASLYYLLAGHGPFGQCERAEGLRRLLQGEQPLPPPSYVHPAVARVLAGCLALRREDRFPTAEQVGWAIEDALEEMGIVASSRDIARFLDEQAGESVGVRRFDIGRCMATGKTPAIPRELTLLQSGTHSALNRPRKKTSRRAKIAGTVAACATVPAFVIALALSTGTGSGVRDTQPAMAPPATAGLSAGGEEVRPASPVETAPPTNVAAPHEAPAPAELTQAANPHAKRHAVHPGGTKTRSRHDGSGGTRK
ncbi:MAG: serine/threonine-protein kinase [Polyangiaceae bacterium]|jgi:eukaryotic-like serine/threonine-protein kinase